MSIWTDILQPAAIGFVVSFFASFFWARWMAPSEPPKYIDTSPKSKFSEGDVLRIVDAMGNQGYAMYVGFLNGYEQVLYSDGHIGGFNSAYITAKRMKIHVEILPSEKEETESRIATLEEKLK